MLKDPVYPLEFRWHMNPENDAEYWLIVNGKGGQQRIPLSGEGTLRLDAGSALNGKILLEGKTVHTMRTCLPGEERTVRRDAGEQDFLTGAIKPTQYGLHQNYPNPFNPTTQIQYELPEDAHVSLILYNTLGQAVRTLVDQNQQAGFKTVALEMNNLSSGIYIYKLRAGAFTAMKKLVLMR